MARRAVRRLGALSVVLFFAAGLLAVGGGFLAAWTLREFAGASFRLTWVIASALFFVVPAAGVWIQERVRVRRRGDGHVDDEIEVNEARGNGNDIDGG